MEPKLKTRICVPVCERSFAALAQATARAAEVGDLIELRLDCLDPFVFDASVNEVSGLLNEIRAPAIVTFRPAEQGGRRELNLESRLLFWLFKRSSSSELLDIEHDLMSNPSIFKFGQSFDWSRVICSYHDFVGLPPNLEQIYERMASTPARILKIAVRANDITDSIPIFRLLERARKEGRELIALAMGTAGMATRILGPARGSFLTYGALKAESGTAPGQITSRELRDVYRIDKIGSHTQIMGIVGLPVAHSISPQIHNRAFAAAGIDAVYLPLEVHDVKGFIERMIHPATRELDWNLRGLSITAPHKAAVMEHLDWIEPAAREIAAVNTIVIEDETLLGYNTDAIGFVRPLLQAFGKLPQARCAVIGAGGAARAALWSLRNEGAEATVFARDVNKARATAEKFGARCKSLTNALFDGFDVVINATPLGTTGHFEDETPATSDQLRGARLAYDLVYNPIETRFLLEARKTGCETLGGLPMLLAQAAEQFRLWTGAEAPQEVMSDAAAGALAGHHVPELQREI